MLFFILKTRDVVSASACRLGSVKQGDRVVLIDDLLATGGTAIAGFDLVSSLGAEVLEFAAVVALPFLDGVGKIHSHKVCVPSS